MEALLEALILEKFGKFSGALVARHERRERFWRKFFQVFFTPTRVPTDISHRRFSQAVGQAFPVGRPK